MQKKKVLILTFKTNVISSPPLLSILTHTVTDIGSDSLIRSYSSRPDQNLLSEQFFLSGSVKHALSNTVSLAQTETFTSERYFTAYFSTPFVHT